MKKKCELLGYYNYTVILTYVGMFCGFSGILSVMEGNYQSSILFLMLAGICDMFDGTIASTKKRDTSEKKFGIQIDSLSDLICFGILPGLITYHITGKTYFSFLVSSVYVLCALIRLAYFNVDEEERQQTCSESRTYYYGMPVTLAALIIPAYFEICTLLYFPLPLTGICIAICMAIAFITPFQLKKPKSIEKICLTICGGVELLFLFIGGL